MTSQTSVPDANVQRLFTVRGAIVVLGLACAFVLFVAFAALRLFYVEVEVARLPSPDGRFEAVVIETNGGATTAFGHVVKLGPKGAWWPTTVASLYASVKASGETGVDVRWSSENTLAIQYGFARAAELLRPVLTLSGRTVTVTLGEIK